MKIFTFSQQTILIPLFILLGFNLLPAQVIPIDATMFSSPMPFSDPGRLGNEQSKLANVTTPADLPSNCNDASNPSNPDCPVASLGWSTWFTDEAILNLGASYNITDIYLFSGYGSPDFGVAYLNSSGTWTDFPDVTLNQYLRWMPVSITSGGVTTAQLKFEKLDQSNSVFEVAIFGTQAGGCNGDPTITSSSTTDNAVTINWSSVSNANDYTVTWSEFVPGSQPEESCELGSAVVQSTANYTISNLNPNTDYKICVRANCGGGANASDCEEVLTTGGGNCNNTPSFGDPSTISGLQNQPNPVIFKDLTGVNAGREFDQIYNSNPTRENEVDFTRVGTFLRIFHEMQRDYRTSSLPGSPDSPKDFPNGPADNANPTNFDFISMNDNYQATKLWYDHFNSKTDINFDGFMMALTVAPFGQRAFPSGWFTNEEWGGGMEACNVDDATIKENARKYIKVFAKTYCPSSTTDCPDPTGNYCPCMVDVLEIGNEPWGFQSVETYRSILEGIYLGMDEYYGANNWGFDITTGAFQAHNPEPELCCTPEPSFIDDTWRDEMNIRIPCDLKDRLSGINIHPYSFEIQPGKKKLTAHPEKTGTTDPELLRIRNAVKWRDTNMAGKKIYVTEFGWDTNEVGETAQAEYIIRSYLIFARYGVSKAAVYEGVDANNDGVDDSVPNCGGTFESSGLWELEPGSCGSNSRAAAVNGEKDAYFAMKKLRSLAGEKIFLKALSENENGLYAYLIGNSDGTVTDLVTWNASAINNNGSNAKTLGGSYALTLPSGLDVATGNVSQWMDHLLTGALINTPLVGSNTSGAIQMNAARTPIITPINNPGGCKYSLTNGSFGNCNVVETCFDGIQNQDETGVDCGGVCATACNNDDDLAVSITATNNPFSQWTPSDFTLTVTNNGTSAMTNIVIANNLAKPGSTAANLAYVTHTAPAGTTYNTYCVGGLVCNEWLIPSLAANASLNLTMTYFHTGNVTQVVMTDLTSSTPTDQVSGNDSDQVTMTVSGNLTIQDQGNQSQTSKWSATEEGTIGGDFKLYPNPTSHEIFAELSSYLGKTFELRIFNSMGQMVYQQSIRELSNARVKVDTRGFANGVYTMNIINGETQSTQNFIVYRAK